MSAIAFPIIIGFGALGVDVAAWQSVQKSMQGAADVAAYSGGIAANANDGTSVTTQAKAVAASSGFVDGQAGVSVTVNSPPSSGSYASTIGAVEVIISQPQAAFLSKIFLSGLTVTARAVSAPQGSSQACLIALDSSSTPNTSGIIGAGSGGLNVSGGGTMSLTKCDIWVNAKNAASIDVTGGGTLNADNITTDGGTSGRMTANQKLTTQSSTAAADPYASTRSIPSWTTTGCDTSSSLSGNISNPMGVKVFCGSITINSTTTFAPGVYIINDGSMTATATINGTGVTFILTSKTPSSDTGVFSMKAGTTINVTAPTSGTTNGIAFWSDANLPHKADNFMAGSVSNITGAVYLPSHLVNYSGSAQASSTCFQLVADEIAISGGANFTHKDCTGVGVLGPSTNSATQLVE